MSEETSLPEESYEPDEALYDREDEEYRETSNQIVSNEDLDGVCWNIVTDFALCTPVEEVAQLEVENRDDLSEEDLREREMYNAGSAIALSETAQQLFIAGVDVLARARRFELGRIEVPEEAPVHMELPDPDEINAGDTTWLEKSPAEALVDDGE